MANKNETRDERIAREQGEYLDEAHKNNDQSVEDAQKARFAGGLSDMAGGDGAAQEARLQQVSRFRAAGEGVAEDDPRLATTPEEAREKGWLGFSPTGAGENDHPMHRTGRLGSLGEFDADKPYGDAGDGVGVAGGQSSVASGSETDEKKDEATE